MGLAWSEPPVNLYNAAPLLSQQKMDLWGAWSDADYMVLLRQHG